MIITPSTIQLHLVELKTVWLEWNTSLELVKKVEVRKSYIQIVCPNN